VSLPTFFVLGAGRSGTTSLTRVLRSHPQVFIPDIKEPSFFAESFQWVRSPVRYADLYASATEHARGDASHIYLEDPSSARTLKAFTPEARFVVVLRHPADRALALYSFMVEHGYEVLPTFERALRAEDRRWRSARFRRSCPQSFWNFMYFRSGLYAEQLERYFELFPRDRLFITTLDAMTENPGDTLAALHRFLGVDPVPVPALPRDGTSKGVRMTGVQVASRVLLRPLARRRIPGAAEGIERLARWNRAPKPTMQQHTRAYLAQRYEPDLRRLRELTGIDFLSR
jgi:hypothetical protein